MKKENLVTSLKLSKRLKELGVKQESVWSWFCDEERDDIPVLNLTEHFRVVGGVGYFSHRYSAFLSGELGEMLPEKISWGQGIKHLEILRVRDEKKDWYVRYYYAGSGIAPIGKTVKNLAEAMGEMLAYLVENKLI